MSPLKIGSEERAGEEWNIGELIEKKELKLPQNYISYQNYEGSSSIRFTNYKAASMDDTKSLILESEFSDNRSKDTTECMEKADLDSEINHYEQKLKQIEWEYNNSMIKDWPKIRENELFFIREIARLKRRKYEKNMTSSSYTVNKDTGNKNKNIVQEHKDKDLSEEEQWDIINKLLTESYEEEEKLMKEMLAEEENYDASEEYSDFINSLDEVGLHNL
jgi:hypothetical protein